VKLKSLTIGGFRGAPVPIELRLGQKSLCLLAENGHGKTTVVDGLEFWSSGDLRHYHREGYQLDSVVNVDSLSASVMCETSTHPPLTRTLLAGTASSLKPTGSMAVGTALPPTLPILRHRTMAEFMDMSSGDKRNALMELLRLTPLIDFRKTLRTAVGNAERTAAEAVRRVTGEKAALAALLGGRSLIELADELRREAQLAQPIASEMDLLSLVVATSPASAAHPDRPEAVADVARRLAEADDDASEAWNEVVQDRDTVIGHGISTLITAGERVLMEWQEDICPLCRQQQDRDDLIADLAQRAVALRDATARFSHVAERMDSYALRVRAAESSLKRLLAASPTEGWPDPGRLTALRDDLRRHADAVTMARTNRTACPSPPPGDLPDMTLLEAIAKRTIPNDRAPKALADLVRLQEQVRRCWGTTQTGDAATAVSAAMSVVLEITDIRIRSAMEAAIADMGKLAADFYGRLVSSQVYGDVALEYQTGRAGGIDFSLVFDNRHRVSPPQRVMSESQLNALGLALFLAQLKVDPQPWRALVLDDVVNSFDASHRVGLARLIAEEFAEWQVLLVTHDRIFATLARKMLPGWRFIEIAAWTPTGGPVLAEGNIRDRLRDRLAEGSSASELGGLARVALEQGLSFPLEKLCLEIRHDPLGRYSAHEYLVALRRGLRDRKSSLAALPVLPRMEADSYLINIGAHDRPADPALTTDELRRLVDDLAELEEAFVCTACGEPVWWLSRDAGRHHQCRCSALAV
jgi:hypothetical protein